MAVGISRRKTRRSGAESFAEPPVMAREYEQVCEGLERRKRK
jgi:hypothetical protein